MAISPATKWTDSSTRNLASEASGYWIVDATDHYTWYFRPVTRAPDGASRALVADVGGATGLSDVYRDLLNSIRAFHRLTGNHLDKAYGHVGELFGAVELGICLNRTGAQGSDGRQGNHHVEIKTITPRNKAQAVRVTLENRNFDRLLVVRIGPDFSIEGRMIERKQLLTKGRKSVTVRWSDLPPLS